MHAFWPRFSTLIVLSKRSFIGKFTLVLWWKLKHCFRKGIMSKRPLSYYGVSLFSLFSFPKTVVILPARPTSRYWVYNELWCLSAAGIAPTWSIYRCTKVCYPECGHLNAPEKPRWQHSEEASWPNTEKARFDSRNDYSMHLCACRLTALHCCRSVDRA